MAMMSLIHFGTRGRIQNPEFRSQQKADENKRRDAEAAEFRRENSLILCAAPRSLRLCVESELES